MPPKKVIIPPVAGTGDEAALQKEQQVRDGINIEDYSLPKSIVTRLAKGVLPPNTQIQGNAMLAMTKSATVFINHLAHEANENALSKNKKHFDTQDVFAALETLEFPDWRERLEGELAKYKEIQGDKKNAKAKKPTADKSADADDSIISADGQPASKKARLDEQATEGEDSMMVRTEGAENTADEGGSGEDGDGTEEDDDEDEEEGNEGKGERVEGEELEDPHAADVDEALDNGEDSD